MSSFLANLITRTRGTAEAIRPRVPALFEPDRQDHSAFSTAHAHWASEVSARAQSPSAHHDAAASGGDRADASQLSRQSFAQRIAAQHAPFAPPPAGSARAPQDAAGTSALMPPGSSGEARPSLPLEGEAARSASRQDAATPSNLARSVAQASAFRPLVGPRPSVSKTPAPQRTSPPAEPAIHVTIGRIEVRAIAPEAPSRRSQPARTRPTVSLDDYLQRQNRGQR